MSDVTRRFAAWAVLAGAAGLGAARAHDHGQTTPPPKTDKTPPKDAKAGGMAGMDHSAHAGKGAPAADIALSPAEVAAVEALTRCKTAAEQCLSFAVESLGSGDPSMKSCAQSTRETAILCEASVALVNARSKLARTQLALCRQACMECQSECEAHAGHHWSCKASAQACAAAVAALNVILG